MYFRMFFIVLIGFYTSRLILQNLGVTDYGIYNVVGGTVSLFAFLNTAMSQATQRFLSYELGRGDLDRLKQIFSMCLNIHILISIIIILLSEAIGLWLLYNKLSIPANRIDVAFWVFQFSILASVINITQVPYNASISAHEKFNVYAGISIIDILLKLTLVFSLQWFSQDRLFWYGFYILCIHLTTALLYRIYCIRHFSECKYHKYWNTKDFKTMTSYTTWSLIGNFANTASDQGVNILLNIFFNPAINAARGMAMQVKTSIASFVYNFQGASIPQIIKSYATGNIEEMTSLVYKTSKISFFLFYLIMLPVWLEMPILLSIWLGEVPPFLIEFSRIILITVLIQSLGGTLQTVIQATGNIRRYQLTVGILNLTILPISYLVLKLEGSELSPFIIAAFISMGVVFTNLYNVNKLIKFSVIQYFKKVILVDFKVLTISIIIPIGIFLLLEESVYRLLILFPVSFIITAMTIFWNGFNATEREWIKSFIINKIKRK